MASWQLFLLVLLLILASPLQGYSTGAPTCIGDRSAPGQPHRLESYQSSLLITGGISVTVGDTLVFLGVPLTLHVGTVYNVTITKKNPLAAVGASSTFFKGIMTRLGGGNENVDTSTVFTIVPGDTDLQPNQYCDSNIGGITHTNPSDKQSVSFQMIFDAPSTNMKWDINIVESRLVPNSRFYYNQFILNVIDNDDNDRGNNTIVAPTSSPTSLSAPTTAPIPLPTTTTNSNAPTIITTTITTLPTTTAPRTLSPTSVTTWSPTTSSPTTTPSERYYFTESATFDIEWNTTQGGIMDIDVVDGVVVSGTGDGGWEILDGGTRLRFNVQDSGNCGGRNANTQQGSATALLRLDMDHYFSAFVAGQGEAEIGGYEELSISLDGNRIASAVSPGGDLGCASLPLVATEFVSFPLYLMAGEYIISLSFTTSDNWFNFDSYYEAVMTLIVVTSAPTTAAPSTSVAPSFIPSSSPTFSPFLLPSISPTINKTTTSAPTMAETAITRPGANVGDGATTPSAALDQSMTLYSGTWSLLFYVSIVTCWIIY